MITAIVQFQLPADMTEEKAAALFAKTAPLYQGVDGLIRKYYLFDPETKVGGGAYLWESRAQAEATYGDEWRERIRSHYGVEPTVTYFSTPVVVDNTTGDVLTAA